MIRIQIPGFYSSDFSGGNTRIGDAQIIDDGKNFDVIDGNCGKGTTRLIEILKKRKIKTPYLHITHAHYDHYYGIRKIIADSYFKPKKLYLYNPDSLKDVSNEVKSEKETLKKIVAEAKAKGIKVVYLKDGDKVVHGDVRFVVYRNQPTTYNGNSDVYLNDGSLCYWFPTLRYLTTGDAGLDCAKEHNLNPLLIKIGHHGNDCPRAMATWLYNHGCRFCWDNDFSEKLTDFLMTGREDCIAVGMKYFGVHGDINLIAQSGYVSIYKDFKVNRYKCSYSGKTALKQPNLDAVIGVLKGTYGSANSRISNLIDAGYYPISAQEKVDEIIKLVKG